MEAVSSCTDRRNRMDARSPWHGVVHNELKYRIKEFARCTYALAVILYIGFTAVDAQSIKEYLFKEMPKQNWKSLSLTFLAGFGEGHAELLQHHYYKFAEKFPNASEQFWNPELSWTNKYKNNDPAQGPRFFGSKNIFVAATDGYHAFKMLQKASVVGAIVLHIGVKKKFKYYIVDAFVYMLTYTAGFYTSYRLIY